MTRNDFNGDGRGDVLWLLGGDSAVSNWLGTASGGFTINDSNAYNALNAMHQFHFTQTGDFNGDGRSDVLWVVDPGPNQAHMIWFSDSSGGSSINGPGTGFSVGSSGWHVEGAGDFNGDGIDDLLWRHENGTLSNWLGSLSGSFTVNDSNAWVHVPTDWHVVGTGDFNGDGRSDLLWQSDGGSISNWLGTASGGFTINDANALTSLAPGEIVGIGDFNGDGRDDLVFRDAQGGIYTAATYAAGAFYFNWSAGFVATVPLSWDIAGVGDYNGDGVDDLLWRNDNGDFSNWLGTGNEYVFEVNDHNAYVHIPVEWQIADAPLV